jgi:uncharacterized Zn finger protein/DNA-binding transcriptional regulator YiaG
MSFNGWAPYVPVAERRAKAQKQLEKMRKKGLSVQPVELNGRTIAVSFWGKGWCDHMESFSDYANRLPRGRTYVRNGSVCHLEILPGKIQAIVSGSKLYNVAITITPLPDKKWHSVKRSCSGRIGSIIDLLRGKLESGVMEVVSHQRDGLFPEPGEMRFTCDCPDLADMCKHVAAVLYGVGARLDYDPEMLFTLRGVNHEELVDVSAVVADVGKSGTSRRRIAATGLADVFGIDLADAGEPAPELPEVITSRKSAEGKVTPVATTQRRGQLAAAPHQLKPAATMSTGRRKVAAALSFPDPLTGNDIIAWRSALGETQMIFADRMGLTAASISQWEKKGKATIGMQSRTLVRLRSAWEKSHT